MGCKPSKLQIQHNRYLFNEDIDIRKRFLTGVRVSKGTDSLEGNFQIAFGKTKRKRYEKVANDPSETPKLCLLLLMYVCMYVCKTLFQHAIFVNYLHQLVSTKGVLCTLNLTFITRHTFIKLLITNINLS